MKNKITFPKILLMISLVLLILFVLLENDTGASSFLILTVIFGVISFSEKIDFLQFKDLKVKLNDAITKANVTTEHLQVLMKYIIEYQIRNLRKVNYFSKPNGEDARILKNLLISSDFNDQIFVDEVLLNLKFIVANSLHLTLQELDLINKGWTSFESYNGIKYPYPHELKQFFADGKYVDKAIPEIDAKENLKTYSDSFKYLFLEK